MRKSGIKRLDETRQIDWLIVSAQRCTDPSALESLITRHFRIPHEPSGNDLTFVQEVKIRRSQRRILFHQESGVHLS